MRMIDKLPKTPNLNESLVRIITTFLFTHTANDNKNADYSTQITEPNTLLQIMGNIAFLHDLVPAAKKIILAQKQSTEKIYPPHTTIISGGINPAYKENNAETAMVKQLYTANGKRSWNDVQNIPEAKIIEQELANAGVKEHGVILETKSTNLKENIQYAEKFRVYETSKHISMLTSVESAVRTRATARKVLGNKNNISVMTYTPTIPNTSIAVSGDSNTRNFWALNDISKQYVYGELLRVIKYSETKEITLSESEEKYVSLILDKFQEYQK